MNNILDCERVLLSEEFTVVIDTNGYAANFSKELCAYCTGFIDEQDYALEFADLFYMEEGIEDDSPKGKVAEDKNPFQGHIGQRLDENGNYSPCCVFLNKRYGSNENGEVGLLTEDNYDKYDYPAPLSVGIFFDAEPTAEQVQIIKTRAKAFFEKLWPKLRASEVAFEGTRLVIHTRYGEERDI
jgi:hypothetical protein